jgi:hypothetical protein
MADWTPQLEERFSVSLETSPAQLPAELGFVALNTITL